MTLVAELYAYPLTFVHAPNVAKKVSEAFAPSELSEPGTKWSDVSISSVAT